MLFSWLTKIYLLIRGDRFSRDKLEEIRDEVHHVTLDMHQRLDEIGKQLIRIEGELKNHAMATSSNYEVLEQKINNNHVANEMMLKMIDDRFSALNLKIELLRR